MFTARQRREVERWIVWLNKCEVECLAADRLGPANHHRAKASALRAALAEIDRLTHLFALLHGK